RRSGIGRSHDSSVLEDRLRIHAAAGGRLLAVHADHHAGYLHSRSATPPAGHGRDTEELPGSRSPTWQNRSRGYGHRSRAAFHAGNDDRTEAAFRVAPNPCVVFLMGTKLDVARAATHHAGPYFRNRACGADERGFEDPRPLEFLDHAD